MVSDRVRGLRCAIDSVPIHWHGRAKQQRLTCGARLSRRREPAGGRRLLAPRTADVKGLVSVWISVPECCVDLPRGVFTGRYLGIRGEDIT
eukprot:scaffold61936_cov33-Phaeocystis_antarctica.AAC.2